MQRCKTKIRSVSLKKRYRCSSPPGRPCCWSIGWAWPSLSGGAAERWCSSLGLSLQGSRESKPPGCSWEKDLQEQSLWWMYSSSLSLWQKENLGWHLLLSFTPWSSLTFSVRVDLAGVVSLARSSSWPGRWRASIYRITTGSKIIFFNLETTVMF